jgi:type II secretory pathway pseudopilin PulG
MKINCKKGAGFSLVELIVAMSIILTLIGLVTINLAGAQQRISLNTVVQNLVSDIRQQQIKAMVGDSEGRPSADSYGIHTDPNQYVLFHGSTYSATEPSNFQISLPSNVQFVNPGLDIIFARVSGGHTGAATLTQGLVGYWGFGEGTGQIVNDSSVVNNDGTLGANSSVASDDPTWTAGKPGLGGALSFDGINDLVSYGLPSSALNNLSALTYAAWVRLNSTSFGSNAAVVVRASDIQAMKVLLINPSERVLATVDYTSTDATSISSQSLSINTWYHIAYTFNAAADTLVRVYINGTEVAYSTQNAGAGSISSDDTFPLTIGNTNTGVRPFPGIIDEVRIYNRALTAAEIMNLYNTTSIQLQDITTNNTKTIELNKSGVVTSVN